MTLTHKIKRTFGCATQREKDKIEVVHLGSTFPFNTWYELLESGRLSLDNPTLAGSALINDKEKLLREMIQWMEEEKMWMMEKKRMCNSRL